MSGIQFAFNPEKEPGQRVEWVKVNGEIINLEKRYTAATKVCSGVLQK